MYSNSSGILWSYTLWPIVMLIGWYLWILECKQEKCERTDDGHQPTAIDHNSSLSTSCSDELRIHVCEKWISMTYMKGSLGNLKNILSLVLRIFLHLEAFEANTCDCKATQKLCYFQMYSLAVKGKECFWEWLLDSTRSFQHTDILPWCSFGAV